jgi:hypothetical protein
MNSPISPLHVPAAALKSRRPLRASSQLLALEQRFMFDGADAAHAAQAAHAAHPTADGAAPAVPQAVQVRAAEPAKDEGKKEVVIVDTSVANYKSLEAGVRDGVGIVEFDGSRDGLAQIAQWAAGQSGLDAIHILSHGSEDAVDLGSMRLTEASLGNSTTQAELAQLGRALTADGDLLIYGCDVAAGDGVQLVAGIARATGADVAASADTTGAARLGGNWKLEVHHGDIDTRALSLAQYDGALTLVSFDYLVDGDGTPTGLTTIDKSVGANTITFSGPEMYIYHNGAPDDGLYAYDPGSTDGNGTKLTITVDAGYSFNIDSFGAQSIDGTLHFHITWANGTTSDYTQGGVNSAETISTLAGFDTALSNMRSITITSDNYATVQNFNITNIHSIAPTTVVDQAHLSQDNGTLGNDFITNVATQTISGTLSANLSTGERVEVSYDNGNTWSDATNYSVGSDLWSTSATLSGSNTFLARVTNVNGGNTPYSHSYTLDTNAPTTTFSGITLSDDTGFSSTDLITKTASQTISATLATAPSGTDTVWGSVDGGNNWTDITNKVSGTTLIWTGATLTAGGGAIIFKVTDQAGNDSGLSIQNYTLDTTAPSTTVASATFSNDSNIPDDFITNVAAQTISGTLGAPLAAGDRVYVSLDNGATWAAATAAVGQTNWTLNGRTLINSSTLKVKVSDTAGNDGTVLSRSYTYDISAPTTIFSALHFSDDTGGSSIDFITKTASQTIIATLSSGLAAGDVLWGSLDGGAHWTDITTKVSGTALNWDGVTLSGSGTLQLKVTDAAGNDSAIRAQAYTLDTTPPATPGTPVLNAASDTGPSSSDGVTIDTTPTFSGTAESGSTVTLYDGATLLGSVVASAGGWTYTTGVLTQGDHTITAVSTDTAGNVSAASAGRTITIDTSAPVVVSVAVPANGTYASSGTLDFTVSFNESVTVDTSGGTPRIAIVVGAATRYADYVSGSGTNALVFRYTVPSGDVDSNGITVGALSANGGSLRDQAGNDAVITLNNVGSTAAVNVDGTEPSITSVSASDADGAYGAGSIITITVDFSTAVDVDTTGGLPTLALEGGGIAVYTGGSGSSTLTFSYTVAAGQNSADLDYGSTGALTLNGGTIIDAGGSHQMASVSLATPGTAGSLGANKDIVVDTTAPTNTVAGAAFSADTGTSASDFITKTAAQTISGTLASNLAAGEHVYVSLDNGGTWALATTATNANTWSLAGQTLTGSGTLKVRVIDDAGNAGAAYAQSYVLDQTAPTIAFSNVAFSADTGSSNSDLVTNTAAQTISATLTAAPAAGDTVYASLDNGNTWIDITSKVSGNTLTWTGVTLAASNTLLLRVTDAAGNAGATTGKAYVLDTTAPTTSVVGVAFSDDSGVSSTDFITNAAAQTVSGTLSAPLAAGETVYVSLDNGGTWLAAASGGGGSTWSLAGQTLTASDTLLVKVTDQAGNDGPVIAQAYTFDTTAPTIAVVDVALSDDTGTSNSDLVTSTAAQTITGTLNGAPGAGDVVWGSLDGGNTWVDVTGKVAGTTLTWDGVTLNAGTSAIVFRITDRAGNDSSLDSYHYTLDTTAPATTVDTVSLSNDNGVSSTDFITNTAAQTLSGTLSANLAAGETVYVSLDNGTTWLAATSMAGTKTWSLAGQTLTGSNTLKIKVGDAAGNEGAVFSRAYVFDTTAPTTGPDGVAFSNDSGVSATDLITNTAAQTIRGTLSANLAADETVYVSLDNGATWVAATSSLGTNTWSLAGQALTGSNTLKVKVSDAAGNDSLVMSRAYVFDTVAPAPAISATRSGNGDASGSLSAALAAGESVEVSLDGGTTWLAATTGADRASWSIAGVGNGAMQVRTVDAAGNTSAPLTVNVHEAHIQLPPPHVPPQLPDESFAWVPKDDQQADLPPVPPALPEVIQPWRSGRWVSSLDTSLSATDLNAFRGPFYPGDTWPGQPAYEPLLTRASADSAFRVLVLPALRGTGQPLLANRQIDDLAVRDGSQFFLQLPADTFVHTDEYTTVKLSARSVDGKPLPGWLRFNADTARFDGKPPVAFEGTLSVMVLARDAQGREAAQVFKITVTKGGRTDIRPGLAETAGRASLDDQFRVARDAAGDRIAALSRSAAAAGSRT